MYLKNILDNHEHKKYSVVQFLSGTIFRRLIFSNVTFKNDLYFFKAVIFFKYIFLMNYKS